MITVITNIIIVQINKFFNNLFILLFEDKKLGKIRVKTAIKKIADIT